MHITWVLLVQEVERHTTSVNPAVGVWSDAAKLVPMIVVYEPPVDGAFCLKKFDTIGESNENE